MCVLYLSYLKKIYIVSLFLSGIMYKIQEAHVTCVFLCIQTHKMKPVIFADCFSAAKHMVETYEGENSTFLPCNFPHYNDSVSKVVVSRDDLAHKYVHIEEQGHARYDTQNELFKGRTSWSDTLGSLILGKPRKSDSGTYTCTLRELGEIVSQTQIELVVKGQKQTQTPQLLLWMLEIRYLRAPVIDQRSKEMLF